MRADTLHRNSAFHDPAHPDRDQSTCPVCEVEASVYPPAPAVRTEVHDDLLFVRPTWDPAPTPWNASGSWVDDPDLDARVVAGILAAVPDFPRLAAEANQASGSDGPLCGTFWGSHGCGLAVGHGGLCVCTPDPSDGPCSTGLKYGDGDTLILAWNGDTTPSPHHWTWFE